MHKLDPIERLPDGTLFRLTPGQLRSVRGLAKCCPSSRSWNRPFSARKNSAAAKSAARAFSPAPAGQNTVPPAPQQFTASRRRNPPANGGLV
mgnify:CR=1 FL=1